jgi:ankyrin repeat protein
VISPFFKHVKQLLLRESMLPTLSPDNERYMEPPKTPPSKAIRTKGKSVSHSELHRAVLRNNSDLVRRILLRGAGPWGHANSVDWWGRTPLHRAAERGYAPILLELIGRGGADVNAQETQWLRTSLHISAERGLTKIITILLSRGALPNILDRQNVSPLMLAIEQGHDAICEQLLEAGTKVEWRNNQDMTALHIACKMGNENVVRMLVNVRKRPNNNSDVEARCTTKDGITTPLHLSAVGGHAGCVRALLEQSADVNVRNHMGWSPLHCTAWYSNVQAAAALMSHPTCKLDIRSIEGETAYDLIRRRKRQGQLK